MKRAHQVPSRPLPAGAPPRPFLIRLLNQQDRDFILRRVRLLKEVLFNGTKVMFFPDFSTDVKKQHVKFQDVKKKTADLATGVVANEVAHFF